jgi:hypothetical protein
MMERWSQVLRNIETHDARVKVFSAQILTLCANPPVIVPGVPGKLTWPLGVMYRYKSGLVAYDIGVGMGLFLNYRSNSGPGGLDVSTTGLLDQIGGGEYIAALFNQNILGTADDITKYYGDDLILTNDNAPTEFTDGDGDLTVDVMYWLLKAVP